MLTRSKSRMAAQNVRSTSPEFEINNQLGLELSESVDMEVRNNENTQQPQTVDEGHSLEVELSEDTNVSNQETFASRTRGQRTETQNIDLNTILELMKKQNEAAERRQQEAQEKIIKEIKEVKGAQNQMEGRIMTVLETKVTELKETLTKRVEDVETKLKEQDSKISEKIEKLGKKNANEIKGIHQKLDKIAADGKQLNERNKQELQETVHSNQADNQRRFDLIEEKVEAVNNAHKDTADRLNSVSVEKGRKLEEIKSNMNSVKETQERLQRRLEELEVRPITRVSSNEPIREFSYNGNDDFPMEFLQELSELQEAYYPHDNTRWIGKYLTDEAAIWWRIVKTKINSFEQFREAFTEKYWGVLQQEKIRDQLEYGRFKPNKSLDMIQYLEKNLLKYRQLIPAMSDRQLITKLARHYDREIQIAVVTRGIRTIEAFEVLLKEYMNIQSREERGERESNATHKPEWKGKTRFKREYDSTPKDQQRPSGSKPKPFNKPPHQENRMNEVNTLTVTKGAMTPDLPEPETATKN